MKTETDRSAHGRSTPPARGEIDVDGLRIRYRRAGKGPPLLLLHGFFGDSRVWRWQVEELAEEFTVVAWDAPGCGCSSDPPEGFRMPEYADCLAGFIRGLGLQRPSVLGLSFGGALAFELYRRHPDVPHALIAADAYAGWSGSFPAEIVERRLQQSLRDLELPAAQVAAKWMAGFVTESAPPALIAELTAIISDFHPAGMAVMIRSLAEADLRDVLPRIAVPTLLLWGEADVRSPLTVAEDLHAQIPGSQLVVIPGAGHLSNVEAYERFNSEVCNLLTSMKD